MPYIINRENLAWAGGFFDGEGSITWQYYVKNKDGTKYKYPKICISQSGSSELLEKFKTITNAGGIYEARFKHATAKLPRYSYCVNGFEKVQYVVALLWGFIGSSKKAQAKKVLGAYLSHARRK